MVDLRAIASREDCMGWASVRVCLKSRHGTIALETERKREGEREGEREREGEGGREGG